MSCRHCGRASITRPRGLCWSCYYTPGIRERYPSTSRYAVRGLGLDDRRITLPAHPTRALPGSPEKIAVLTQRVRKHQTLWHPDDARLDAEARRPAAAG